MQDMSLADLKLDRQRKRNEAAEASLSAVPPLLEKRQSSRTKGKWKPFDYAHDGSGGVPVETRVNTYSRTSSHSRPMSALSHRTDESTVSDTSGFQVCTGRKGRRHPIDLRSYGPEKQQTTVEATFDKREIYEVFGNALPGPEYLEQNAGYKNGQVQFLQHPNGDVSAQQWAASRYEWVNLGQFSNIRKKVEGQLASDRLKGEMAHHTLQQNTLQYFRTVAKQREAAVMGLPFGPKEIEAALPAVTLTHIGKSEKDANPQTHKAFSEQQYTGADIKTQETPKKEPTDSAAPASRSPLPPYVPREPQALRWEVTGGAGGAQASDPFYVSSVNPSIAHSTSTYSNRVNYAPTGPASYAYPNVAQTPYRMAQSYHFPPVPVPNQTLQSPGAQKYFADRAAIAEKMQSQWRQVYGNQPGMGAYGQQMLPFAAGLAGDMSTSQTLKAYEAVGDREIVAPQPKSVSSMDRSTMRQKLYKLGEAAKERNLSQNNIRTVLHDPHQSPSAAEPLAEKAASTAPQEADSPLLTRTVASKKPTTQSSPVLHARDHRKDILQQSSPDTTWTKRPYEHSTPLLPKSSTSKGTSQAIVGTAAGTQNSIKAAGLGDSQKTYEEHLNDWWTNGSTFARQEDLYQAIVAAQAADSKLHSPPAHLTPIGPPSRKAAPTAPSFNETTTRLLIPVWENLASYVDGPAEKRRDYWCSWGPAPEWCIDRSPPGNKSFFEADWGTPPQRVGRDPRYSDSFDEGTPGSAARVSRWQGVDQRFAYAGRY